jgi:hypothetical protein
MDGSDASTRTPLTTRRSFISPQNQSEFDIFRQASAVVFQSWIDQSTPPGIIQFSGTREVVHDYEEVRKALGYNKIHFLGAS